MLTKEQCIELESRVLKRFSTTTTEESSSNKLIDTIRKISVEACIATLQEYERLMEEKSN